MVYRANLAQLGIPLSFGTHGRDAPKKTAEAMRALLKDKNPKIRKNAVMFLQTCWAMPDAPPPEDFRPVDSIFPKKTKRRPVVPAGTWMKQFGVFQLLEEIARSDNDDGVRKSAIETIAEIRSKMKRSGGVRPD